MKSKMSAASVLFSAALAIYSTPFGAPSGKATTPANPAGITYDSLDWEIPLGDRYRTELKNGCVAYIAGDSLLPLVNFTAYVRYGALADPKGKEGLSSLFATMMRNGGTEKFPADTLDELVDLLALRFRFSTGMSQFTVSGGFLAEYRNNALEILREMMFKPVFDGKRLERERKIMLESIRHRFDNPGPTLKLGFEKLMYAGQAPGRLSTEASIKKITRQDLIDLHRSVIKPENIIFCIAGSFEPDSMRADLERVLTGNGPAGNGPSFPQVSVNRKAGCLLIHKPISQAYVRCGLPLFQRPHPDYYAMSILNLIIGGGGFTSRLGKSVRSDAGLTYSIYSNAESNYSYPGTFYIDFFTKNASFAQAVALTLKEIRLLTEEKVTEQELANAKSSLIGELPSMFRSREDIVTTYGWNEYYHRAPDHYRTYPEKIASITREDLLEVARKYVVVDSLSFTVVGDTTALLHQKADDFSLAGLRRTTIVPASLPSLP